MMQPTKMLLALACSLFAACAQKPTSAPADLVLLNGKVKTPTGWVESLAITDGKIVAVGSSQSVRQRVGERTTVVDLQGKVVLPGFHDMHVHPIFAGSMYSGADHTHCGIPQGSSAAQLTSTLRECVSSVKGAEWVTGGQWDASTLGVPPHRSLIDAVSGDTPVFIHDTSGHSAWANSRALAIAGIDAKTPDPEGGIIERDAQGQPTGILREAASELVHAHVPKPSPEILRRSLAWGAQEMLKYGVTSFTEASTGFVGGYQDLDAYAALARDGGLKQRTRVCITWAPGDSKAEEQIANRAKYATDRLAVDCVKIFLDGVPTDSHTAAMLEPYAGKVHGRADEASRFGLLLLEQSVTNEAVTRFDAAGLTVKFHAAGDAAVRSGLDAIEAARRANGMRGPRHDVGHCTFVSPKDMQRGSKLNATFEVSPYLWSPSPINDDITAAVGAQKIDVVWPVKDLIGAGALVVPGSDWAVVPSVNPWFAVEALVTRQRHGGSKDSFGAKEAIDVAQAIDLFTVNAARHNGNEERLGKIASGMLADFIVIDRDPYSIPATELHLTKVLMTFINGEKVFEASAKDRQ